MRDAGEAEMKDQYGDSKPRMAGGNHDRRNDGDGRFPAKEGRARSVVTYESKAKARSREEEERASEGRSTSSTSLSVYKRGPSGSASASGSTSKGATQKLFLASPEISNTPAAHELFTPSPERLFTPLPEHSLSPEEQRPRPRVPPGVGIARKVARAPERDAGPQKRKREVMDYVSVPPMPYKRARTERAGDREREGRANASRSVEAWRAAQALGARETKSRRERSETREWGSASGERGWGSSKSRSRSRPTQLRKNRAAAAGEVQPSLGDVLNQAWTQNERVGTIPVGGAAGQDAIRIKRKHEPQREPKPEPDEEDEVPRKRVKKVLPSGGQRDKEDGQGGRKRPKKQPPTEMGPTAFGRSVEQHGERARVKRVPRDGINSSGTTTDVAVKPTARAKGKERARSRAWCTEENGLTLLSFDYAVEDADQMACAALMLTRGKIGNPPPVRLRSPPRPCLVWPVPQRAPKAEEDMWAGGVVLGDGGPDGGKERSVREDVTKEEKRLDGVPRGRTTQRKNEPPQNQIADKSKPRVKPRALPGPSKSLGRVVLPLLSTHAAAPTSSVTVIPAPLPTEHQVKLGAPSALSTHPLPTSTLRASLPASPISPQSVDVPLFEEGAPMLLSTKALGKQKAWTTNQSRTPSPARDGTSSLWNSRSASRGRRSASRGRRSTSRGHRSASRGRSPALRSPTENIMRTYLHGLDPSPPGLQTSPQSLNYYPSTSLDLLLFPIPSGFDVHLDDTQLPLADTASLLYLPPDSQPYGDGTVDPSLLGGMMEPEAENYDAPDEEHMPMGLNSPSPSVASSLPPRQSSASPVALRVSGRQPVQRRVPNDMLPTDLLDSDNSSDDFSDAKPPSAKPKPKPKEVRRKVKDGETKVNACATPSVPSADRFFRYSGPPWPPGDPDAFCHQCRRKTKLMSMKYETCRHIFCVRCIMMKYDPGTVPFELNPDPDDCLKCNSTCSCDTCCRSRGVEYAYARYRVQRSDVEPSTPRTPRMTRGPRVQQRHDPLLDQMVIEPSRYFATIYDHSGARIARTFIGTGADADDHVVVARRVKPPRVFIGAVQEHWDLGPNPTVYIEPTPRKPRGRGPTRYFIGKQSVLSLRVRPRPATPAPVPVPATVTAANPPPAAIPGDIGMDLAFDAPLSPLSSLGDSTTAGEEDGQGESGSCLPVHTADGGVVQKPDGVLADAREATTPSAEGGGTPLTDSEVAKAISRAYMELGVPTILALEPSV
ncbi:hypothetical protein FB451DRAFT_1246806 [Mycena latifolia]|nr:hypothetical protein FB451DRAFT_1246806 [Mycena latifolia]